jgi:hypothetical protein
MARDADEPLMFVDKWSNNGVGHGVGVRHVEMRRRPVVGGNKLREGGGMRGMRVTNLFTKSTTSHVIY